jgi:regulator of protease activity HflC (stomatin/prohibitin superfamily)
MFLYVVLALVAIALLARVTFRQVTVFEYERGLRYRRGRFDGVLEPGAYVIWPRVTTVIKVDIRPAYLAVPGQEVISADGVGLKITVSAQYQVSDPARAINAAASYQTAIYAVLQLALREIVATRSVDAILTERVEINRQLLEAATPRVAELGVTLLGAEVKDIMFPGELKKVFAQVVKARQEGLAILERARGETAALRNLANAAAMLEQRPALLQLRLLQTIGQASGNTVVLGMGGTPQTIPVRTPLRDGQQDSLPPADEGEE